MSSSIIERVARVSVGLTSVFAVQGALATDGGVLRLGAQVCVEGIPGLAYNTKTGIDAVEGWIRGKSGRINFMISRQPNLPAAMNIARGKNGYVLPKLTGNVAFIAESKGPLGLGATGRPVGYGTERLYGFVMRTIDFPDDERQRVADDLMW